jgi:hypothetical protein
MGNFHWNLGEPQLAEVHYTKSKLLLDLNKASKHPLAAANKFKLGYLKYHEAQKGAALTSPVDLSTLSNTDSGLCNQTQLEEAMCVSPDYPMIVANVASTLLEEALSILALHPAIPSQTARVHYVLSEITKKRARPDALSDSKKHATEALRLITNHCKETGMKMPSRMGETEYNDFVSVKTR